MIALARKSRLMTRQRCAECRAVASFGRASPLRAAYGALRWIDTRPDTGPDADGVVKPLRAALKFNEGVCRSFTPATDWSPHDPSRITEERVNGDDGLGDDFDPDQWTLTVHGVHGQKDPVVLTMADIHKMPSMEMTTEFFCIEGWSLIQRFKGVPLREFMRRYPPMTLSGAAPDVVNGRHDLVPYVGMSTPSYQKDDGSEDRYYVGLDMPSALHAQTMLCYEMNGKPLTLEHGAPLQACHSDEVRREEHQAHRGDHLLEDSAR